MGLYKYSIELNEENSAAQALDLNASYKDLANICRAVKGKNTAAAKKILEKAISGERAIPYKKFSKGCGHRSELGGRKGRYPKKECRIMLELIKAAEANAEHKGLNKDALLVQHAAAFKQNVFPRHRRFFAGGNILGYGKMAFRSDLVTARVELVLREIEKKKSKEEKRKEGAEQKEARKEGEHERKAEEKKREDGGKAEGKKDAKREEKSAEEKAALKQERAATAADSAAAEAKRAQDHARISSS
jgi:ribosomal protein uL22